MATYVIGDVQGCYLTMRRLLKFFDWNPNFDRLIFLGDVLNRGPRSLEVLRFLYNHQERAKMVLGNHDIYALALFLNATSEIKAHTLDALLSAPDAQELFGFLRKQPIIRVEGEKVFVHAGILPMYSVPDALSLAHKISERLISPKAQDFLLQFYKFSKRRAEPGQSGEEELRVALASMIFLRMCGDGGNFESRFSSALSDAPSNVRPWFTSRTPEDYQIYFGHWAALGYFRYKNYTCLDSGGVWGRYLTALRLDDGRLYHVAMCD